jgi:hypothetical protein
VSCGAEPARTAWRFSPCDRVASTRERDQIARMLPAILCLIVLAMPVAVSAARAERRPASAKAYRLKAKEGDGVADVDDDDTLFG